MTKNMGTVDRTIRALAAVVVLILYVAGAINGAVAGILGVLAAIWIVTAAVGFCPAYVPLKISTRKK